MLKKKHHLWALCAIAISLVALNTVQPALALSDNPITRISIASDGAQGNDDSDYSAVSDDGRYVAFDSYASNLVPEDSTPGRDIFVHDRQTGEITLVSINSDSVQANDESYFPAISGDGRYVVFTSFATNLVSGDTNGKRDIFLHDRQTGATERVSVASDGTQGNNYSSDPAVSNDGCYVVFSSWASNLVPDDSNLSQDIFIHDCQTGATERVSIASDVTQANSSSFRPAITADGRYVAFESNASNLVSGDTNGRTDVFVHDRQTGKTTLVSVASDGTQGNSDSGTPALSTDGRYVIFRSWATNLVPNDTNNMGDVFVHDRQTGKTTLVSVASDGTQANRHSYSRSITFDGRYVVFYSDADNLVPGDTNGSDDIFVHDRLTGMTERVSVAPGGSQTNDDSNHPTISANGRFVTFTSYASNLAPGDTNGSADIFVKDLWTETFLPLTVK
jgi:archaellum component FlaF (FlaF/FlaG flagellin family)